MKENLENGLKVTVQLVVGDEKTTVTMVLKKKSVAGNKCKHK